MLKKPLIFSLPWYKVEESGREQTMREIAAWGVRKLVAPQYFWQQDSGAMLSRMQELAGRHGMSFAAAHGLLGPENDLSCAGPEAMAAHQRFLAELAAAGVRTYTVHSGAQHPQWASAPQLPEKFYRNVQQALETLLPAAEQHGITLALENIYEPLPVLERLVRIVENIGHPRLGLCLDTGHANVNAAGLATILALLSPRLVTCHLHDNDGQQDQHAAPGQGNVDWQWLAVELGQSVSLLQLETESRQYSPEIWQSYRDLFQDIAGPEY
ncbi:MAG: sugar phosphate isomerase/epimerase [Oligosphaeraceae bacterium]|nr:sugar phosphate isomerase/epimerase [Oligosphaeraceae bacterium]